MWCGTMRSTKVGNSSEQLRVAIKIDSTLSELRGIALIYTGIEWRCEMIRGTCLQAASDSP
jgi:hypothetical protein